MLKGDLHNVGFPGLVQMLCLENRGAVVQLSRHGEDGDIYILEGKVVHVTYGPLRGEEAFFRLAWWTQGSFRVRDLKTRPPTTVHMPTEHLLMEAMRRLDEDREELGTGPVEIQKLLSPEEKAADRALTAFLVQALSRAERWVERLKSGKLKKKSALKAVTDMVHFFAELAQNAPSPHVSGLPLSQAIAAISDKHGELRLVEVRDDRVAITAVSERYARQLASGLVALVQYYCAFFARLFHSPVCVAEWIEIYNVFVLDLKQALIDAKL